MDQLQKIYDAIAAEGFSAGVLAMIDNYANDIEHGRTNISRFTLPEHAGVCTAVAGHGAAKLTCHSRRGVASGADAAGGEGQCKPSAEISSLNLCQGAACARSDEQDAWEYNSKQ